MQLRAARAFIPVELEASFLDAVQSALNAPSSCVPDGAIMVSLANEYHTGLRDLGLQRIRASQCLLDRFVSLCFGFDDGVGKCVRAQRIAASEFLSESYHRLLWTKWHVLRIASSAATHVFYIDADVLLFKNPFPTLMEAAARVAGYDVLFQAEGLCASCAASCPMVGRLFTRTDSFCASNVSVSSSGEPMCPMNGGQLLVARNSRLVRRVLHAQPCFRHGQVDLPLDQYISDAVRSENMPTLRTCALPSNFATKCWWRPAVRSRCDLVSWHANCITGESMKQMAMRTTLADVDSGNETACAGKRHPGARRMSRAPRSE